MEKSEIKPLSVIVGNCVTCDGLVRIPSNARANVEVRCPHCGDLFPLQAILDKSIPELEVMTEPPRAEVVPHIDRVLFKDQMLADEEKPREKFVVPRQLTNGAKRKRRHRRREGSSSSSSESGHSDRPFREQRLPASFSRDSNGSEANGLSSLSSSEEFAVVTGLAGRSGDHNPVNGSDRTNRLSDGSGSASRRNSKSRSHSGSSRSRKRESNSTFEILKVVIGGALAFPIAYLILFWLFRQDPLGIGPAVGNVMPFAVPVELRGGTPEASVASDEAEDGDEDEMPRDAGLGSKKTNGGILDTGLNPGFGGGLNGAVDSADLNSLPVPDVDPDKINVDQYDGLLKEK